MEKTDNSKKSLIPKISDNELKKRMKQVKILTYAVSDIKGNIHRTTQEYKGAYDIYYMESKVNPRTCAFNFDDKAKIIGPAHSLKNIGEIKVFIEVMGYYGFMKVSLAEVLAQIPKKFLKQTKAFMIDPECDGSGGGFYHEVNILLYGEDNEYINPSDTLPSCTNYLKTIDVKRVKNLKDKIYPMVIDDRLEVRDIGEPFLKLSLGFLCGVDPNSVVIKEKLSISEIKQAETPFYVYQEFNDPDRFNPTYANVINQMPDELINDKTIGFVFSSVVNFKTKEGFIHKATCFPVERLV